MDRRAMGCEVALRDEVSLESAMALDAGGRVYAGR